MTWLIDDPRIETEQCDRCEGEGLVPVGHLPNGDEDCDVCDVCDGEGVLA